MCLCFFSGVDNDVGVDLIATGYVKFIKQYRNIL